MLKSDPAVKVLGVEKSGSSPSFVVRAGPETNVNGEICRHAPQQPVPHVEQERFSKRSCKPQLLSIDDLSVVLHAGSSRFVGAAK
jgi:hypothetical protein